MKANQWSVSLLIAAILLTASPVWAGTRVLITVDVESYANGNPEVQVWGRVGQGEHGITRIMDMLDARSMKGTFFLTPYDAGKFGEITMAEAARAIDGRGHDLQLHTHPAPMYEVWGMSQASLAHQTEILSQGIDMLERWTGKRPLAHRAGGYLANLDTLEACRRLGLRVDASLSPAAPGTQLPVQIGASNSMKEVNGVLELPVTYYVQAGIGSWRSLRIVDIEASTLKELQTIVRQARDAQLPTVSVMMHSFSFVRDGKVHYDVEKRLGDFLDFLAAEPGIEVTTVSKLHDDWLRGRINIDNGTDVVPYTGWWLTYLRAVEDIDKGRKNIAVAMLPPIGILVIVAGIALLRRRRRQSTMRAASAQST